VRCVAHIDHGIARQLGGVGRFDSCASGSTPLPHGFLLTANQSTTAKESHD
jgi:hypothetical protein